MSELRRFGVWAGEPEGRPEDVKRCIANVFPADGRGIHYQCHRSRGHGPDGEWCKQHDPAKVAARRTKREAKWKEDSKRRSAKWRREAATARACQGLTTEALEAGVVVELIAALKAVTEGMDRSGGDRDGMPKCPWCSDGPEGVGHLSGCVLPKARAVIGKAEGK